jgi:hypothetical protein
MSSDTHFLSIYVECTIWTPESGANENTTNAMITVEAAPSGRILGSSQNVQLHQYHRQQSVVVAESNAGQQQQQPRATTASGAAAAAAAMDNAVQP